VLLKLVHALLIIAVTAEAYLSMCFQHDRTYLPYVTNSAPFPIFISSTLLTLSDTSIPAVERLQQTADLS